MAKERNRGWQSARVRRAFEVVRAGDVPPVVVEALAELAQARNDLKTEVRASVVAKPKRTDREIFHSLHTVCQPVAQAITTIILAASGPAISRSVNYSDEGVGGVEWLIANAIGYGIPALLLPILYFDKLSPPVRAALFWVIASLFVSVALVSALWRG